MTNHEATSVAIIQGLQLKTEEAVSLSPDEFRKIPVREVQKLLGDLLRATIGLEAQVGQLQTTGQRVEGLQKKCADLQDFAPVGYFVVDNRGIIVDVNFTACDMMGFSKDGLVGSPFMALAEPRYFDALRSYLKEVADTGKRLSYEIEMDRLDGTTFYAELETVSLYENSSITYRISVADITPRRRAEAVLTESERRFKELADLLPEPVFETDNTGRAIYANRKAMGTFGFAQTDLERGVSVFEFVAPDDRNAARERFKMVLERGDVGPAEHMLLAGDGKVFPAIVHSAQIVREGDVTGVRGVIVDISENKRKEEALRAIEERLETTLDSMIEGCQIIGPDWQYKYVNDAAAKQGHRTREQLLGHTLLEMYPGIETTELFRRVRDCIENRVASTVESEVNFPDGPPGKVELRIEPVPQGVLILSLDVTGRKATQNA